MARKPRRFPWFLFFLLLVLTGVGTWYFVIGQDDFAAEEGIPPSLLAQAQRRNISSTLLLSGEVIPEFQVEVKPEVGGKIKELAVETGDSVNKGDILAIIDDTDLQTEKEAALTEIEGASLSVEKNRGNYERAKALFEEKLISKEVYANLEADLRIAENTLEKARRRLQTVEDKLSKTRILAPADGTILDIPVSEGQVVTAAASVNSGTLLMTFANLSRLLIDTHVNQVDVPKVRPGQEVDVKIQGEDERPVKAQIEFVAPLATVKNNIKGFQVQAVIREDEDRLKPGMSVSMTVPTGAANDVVSVPIAAIFSEDDEYVVYVRKDGEDSIADRRKVKVGVSNLSYAEIQSGLDEGEEILLVNPRTLKSQS